VVPAQQQTNRSNMSKFILYCLTESYIRLRNLHH